MAQKSTTINMWAYQTLESASKHFFATPRGKKKNKSTNDMMDDNSTKVSDATNLKNLGNIISPMSLDQPPKDHHNIWEAKQAADLQALLPSCSLDRRGNVSQYHEPIFGMSSTSTYTAPKVKDDGNTEPTQSDYAKMLHDDKTVVRNNLVTTVNMIVSF